MSDSKAPLPVCHDRQTPPANSSPSPGKPPKLIRRPLVEQRTGLSRSSIYARMAEGTFPLAVPLGGRAVAWIEDEIDEWVRGVIEARAYRTAKEA
ncbi:MAG: AlpA family transcriptional regulator [Desulfobacteraceae bacterium]|nr:AlpA family transcriptional regulator [Desulfobacteraceae bacterium]